MNRKRILMAGSALLVCTLLIGGAWIVYQQEVAQTVATYGEAIMMLCDPIQADGNANRDNLPGSTAPFQAVVFGENELFVNQWHHDLAPEWQANSKDEVDLVICVRNVSETVERCEYGDAASESYMERIQKSKEVYIFNAETRSLVAERMLVGDDPAECPDVLIADDGETKYEIGTDIPYTDFEDAIRSYMEP